MNESSVLPARIFFRKPTGARVELFCLEPEGGYASGTGEVSGEHGVIWKCMVGNAAAWSPGLTLEKKLGDGSLIRADLIERMPGAFRVRFRWTGTGKNFSALLDQAGQVPLPPYLDREPEPEDRQRYQTVYAREPGSVAAPTAGLHFTPGLLKEIRRAGFETAPVTLHVGAGTFLPVKSARMAGHEMHAETVSVGRETITQLMAAEERPVISVGTTSLRTVESLYWLGVIWNEDPIAYEGVVPELGQWTPYEKFSGLKVRDALQAVLSVMDKRKLSRLEFRTRLLIAPPYVFRIARGLLTNFHQPRSTLLLLVAAFAGEAWKEIYQFALERGFRFLSYGDCSLLLQ